MPEVMLRGKRPRLSLPANTESVGTDSGSDVFELLAVRGSRANALEKQLKEVLESHQQLENRLEQSQEEIQGLQVIK